MARKSKTPHGTPRTVVARSVRGRLASQAASVSVKIVFPSGGSYEGQVVNDVPHGHGTMSWPSGFQWTGSFCMGTMEGLGVFVSSQAGASFEFRGNMKDGRYDGFGVCTWGDGSTFQGYFSNGLYDGKGSFKWVDGKVYEGNFRNGLKEGSGTYSHPDRTPIYKGQWSNDVKEGEGAEYLQGQLRFEGTFTGGCPLLGRLVLFDEAVAMVECDGRNVDPLVRPQSFRILPRAAATAGLAEALCRRQLWSPPAVADDGRMDSAPLLVKVLPDSDEWRAVEVLLNGNATAGLHLQMTTLSRVENEGLLGLFLAKRAQVRRQSGGRLDPFRAERWAFHGTGQEQAGRGDPVGCIVEEGFHPMLAGTRVGARYGNGTYFARSASFSHSYAQRAADGSHCMLMARLVVGEYTAGVEGMVQPPLMAGHASLHYHSLVDNPACPSIFVVQDSACAYPAYVIHYRLHHKTSASESDVNPDSQLAKLGADMLGAEVSSWFHEPPAVVSNDAESGVEQPGDELGAAANGLEGSSAEQLDGGGAVDTIDLTSDPYIIHSVEQI